ncbi:centrosome-associated protein 350 isoform X1 [Alosa sapidissima]|uniref:centrosome-associated protein 350 isoform X1 n=3 Tax=Alosa sapidissima TaxID=34773 RepID=UPI001C0803FD|nr:centrosome-associated protein 350 isoform X1 [Alosa sapidissima]
MKPQVAHRLRRIENRLEAVPRSSVLLDSLMDPKETSTGLWTFSKKGLVQCGLSRTERAECSGNISSSPLKNSSLDNSLKKTGHVDSKEQLSPYRELSPHSGLPLQLEDQTQIVETNATPLLSKAGLSQMVFQRDTRYAQTVKPASTFSSMVSDTSVHYLNDQSSINVAGDPVHQLATNGTVSSYNQDQEEPSVFSQGFHPQMETFQNSSPSCASQRLESLRRQQTDDKLEKLKERIRRQREHLDEAAEKKQLLGSLEKPVGSGQLYLQSSKTVPSAHVRKVITAPPAPVYKGFNTSEIKSHSPDCQEEDLTRLRREIYRDLTRQLTGEGTRPKVRFRERSKGKKPVKPVRKVHRSGYVPESDSRPATISTSTWREGQKLVKMMLGPSLQSQCKSSPESGHGVIRTGSLKRPPSSSPSDNLNQGKKIEDGKTAAVHLSTDIQDILDDLELDTPPRKHVERMAKKPVSPRVKTKDHGCIGVNHAASPTNPSSMEALKPDQVRRKRHYDSAAVRQYISRQQVERRRRQTEERRSQQEEMERRNQRLQELYRKQKESFNKQTAAATSYAPTVGSTPRCLLETYTKLLPEQTQLETDVLLSPTFTSTHQQTPLYQPSNESDKENKHQNRPQSASSGDISVSEQQSPALSRNEVGLPTKSSWVQGDGQCSPSRQSVAIPLITPPKQTFPQWPGEEWKNSAPSPTCLHAPALPGSLTTMTSRMSRLEVLKSTATSLSNRIESEARKLLLTCKGSQMCVSELSVDLPNHWARMASSNIDIVAKPEHSVEKIQKLHCTGLTTYDGTLPGVGNLYTLREPQERTAETAKNKIPFCIADSNSKLMDGNLDQAEEEQIMFHHDDYSSNASSISDGSLTERKANSQQPSMHVTVLDIDCIQQESSPLHQFSVFSSGRDKCKLFTSAIPQDASTAAWKELTKGSPHSVINIFTKNLHSSSSKVMSDRRSGRSSPVSSTGHSEGHRENNMSSQGSNSNSKPVIRNPNRHSISNVANKQGNSPQDDLKHEKSDTQSFSPVGSHASSFCSASSSLDMEASVDVTLVEGLRDDWSAVIEPGCLGSMKESSKGNSTHSSLKGLDTDSTTGAASVYSLHSLFVHSKTSQRRTTVCPSADSDPTTSSKGSSLTGDKGGVVESPSPNWALHSTSAMSSSLKGNASPAPNSSVAEPVVTAGGLQCAPGALQQRMAAELMYLDSIEESIRQLSDVERIRGVSLAQQEALSLAHVLKSQQQAHEQDFHQLKVKAEQDFESQIEVENAQQRETQVCYPQIASRLSIQAPTITSHCDEPQYTFLMQTPTSSRTVSGSGAHMSASLLSFEERRGVLEEAQDNATPSDSIPSPHDDKDSMSVATEYSLKFDESMTEDEIEERSFRSLLPSESHRRGTLEKKQSRHEESEEEPAQDLAISLDSSKAFQQDNSIPFSSGQNSFSRFTMEMVRQYMKEEEVRAQHQSSLLQLRQRALKEKTRAELAWLEHLKKRLRDKGEDDKMPPIRKKQRVLLLKLQQEQAEIKRLQEANKAARKERQLLLKQQEEIERMRSTTLRLRERLKSACHVEPTSFETMEEPVLSNMTITDANSRSTSPLSMSGSETSSIMQRLKKMHSHMDEKFLTKREQQLMQRRSYAEELLQWKQRLDSEEREIRRMERQAMSAWDRDMPEVIPHQKDAVVQKASTVLSMYSGSSDIPSTEKLTGHSDLTQSQLSSQHAGASFSQESDASQRDLSPSGKTILSPSHHLESSSGGNISTSSGSVRQICSSDQISSVKKSASDQSSIESRISALKEELRKRKTVVHQLKKEQKKRQKERLKAQEANLLKQLESYNDFIKKTKSELSKDQGITLTIKPEINKLTTEKTRIKSSPPQRPETSNSSEDGTKSVEIDQTISDFQVNRGQGLIHEESLSDEDPPTVTPTPVLGSPDLSNSPKSLVSSESQPRHTSQALSTVQSGSENILSKHKAEVTTEVESLKSEKSTSEHAHLSDVFLSLELVAEPDVKKLHSLSSKDHAEESRRVNGQDSASKLKPEEESHNGTDDVETTPSLPNQMSTVEHKTSADGYNDDFESLAESSLTALGKHSSPSTPEEQRKSFHKSVTISEDEIGEELSSKSKSISDVHSEHLLDLKSQTAKSIHQDGGEDLISGISTDSSTSNSQVLSAVDKMDGFSIGERVLVRNLQLGTLRFKGQTRFAKGFWAGVELDTSEGSNDGTCDRVVYFECKPGHGVFVSPNHISRLQEGRNVDVDTTDDEDSFVDDTSHKEPLKDQLQQQSHVNDDSQKSDEMFYTGDKGHFDQTDGSCELQNKLTTLEKDSVAPVLNWEPTNSNLISDNSKDEKCSLINGESIEINLVSTENRHSPLPTLGKSNLKGQGQEVELLTFLDSLSNEKGFDTKISTDDKSDEQCEVSNNYEKVSFNTFADQLFKNCVTDAVKQYQQIQKAKLKKIEDANLKKDDYGGSTKTGLPSTNIKMDEFYMFNEEEEDITSPELYNRQESPVLDASGQQELAKRLAELELSRELLDVLGDEPDWFEEDFGLSSQKEQRQKHLHIWQEGGISGAFGSGPIQQVMTPPRPELPLQANTIPERPVMIVPHGIPEMEKLVYAATQEIWDKCRLGMGASLAGFPRPQASVDFLGGDTTSENQATYCKQSYKQAVFDLSWEVIKDIFAKDHKTEQPQWMKPQRIKSSYFHGIKCMKDMQTVQAFLTEEVLKLYGLKREHNQKTDWQKMLKFGRKKRDRVDHILVQELHDEESQWVNYDEDELYVKMQLADGIFDALLKDTEDVLTQIQERRSSRVISS